MAKMIPYIFDGNTKSAAEKKIFDLFRNDKKTEKWVVIHSLGLSEHITNVRGEVDFLVLAPGYGIFALEVKGGRVRREGGVWIYTDQNDVEHCKPYGPFSQAMDGMYSIKKFFTEVKKDSKFNKFLFSFGVMFPDVEFENSDPDYKQYQVYDSRFRNDVSRFIRELSKNEMVRFNNKGLSHLIPTEDDVKEIVNSLRQDFDFAEELKVRIEDSKANLLRLTEEQFRCIDGLSYNDRCLINGPAGTGKTILSLRHTKESIASGDKVGLFCFNLLLEQELQNHFAKDNQNKPFYVGSITHFLEELIKKHKLLDFSKIEDKTKFYNEDVFDYGSQAIELEKIKFDKIIVDEAQDILKDNFLLILDQLLVGGLKEGKWFLFGDYNTQNIFNKGNTLANTIEKLKSEASFSIFNLTKNCRNTIYIQKEMNKIANVDGETLNKNIYAPEVNYILCDENNEKEKIEEAIDELLNKNIKRSQITILSPFKKNKSVVESINRHNIEKYKCGSTLITFSTIQGFKGLENDIIFLTDIHTYSRKDLTYVGMSRAKTVLYIFENKHARTMRMEMEKELSKTK